MKLSELAGLVGGADVAPYASRYKASKEYLDGVAHPRGSAKWWADPLVIYLAAGTRADTLVLREKGTNDVSAVLNAVDDLDGFHGGQWPSVSRSIEALASALDQTGKYNLDRAHILDAIGYPVAALYDARVAAERAAADDDETPEKKSETSAQARLRVRLVRQRSRPVLLTLAALAAIALVAPYALPAVVAFAKGKGAAAALL